MRSQQVRVSSMPSDKKLKKKAKRRFVFLKTFLTLILFIGAFVLIALTPLFNIKEVTVTGSRHYKQEDIINSAALPVGENGFKTLFNNIGDANNVKRLLLLRCANAEDNILLNRAYIKTVRVKYRLPDKFSIVITERQPMGFVPYLGTNLVVDNEAYVLDTTEKPTSDKQPVIKGLNFESYELGQALKLENPLEFDTVNKILRILRDSEESSNLKFNAPINHIDVSNLSKTCIYVDSRLTVNFGDVYNLTYEELLYRVNFFKQIYNKNLKKQDKGLIDFTMGENPKFIPH